MPEASTAIPVTGPGVGNSVLAIGQSIILDVFCFWQKSYDITAGSPDSRPAVKGKLPVALGATLFPWDAWEQAMRDQQMERPDTPGHMGLLIKRFRSQAGITQRQLARAAGISVGALRDLEQGRTLRPRRVAVENLVAALGIDRSKRARLMLAWCPGPPVAGVPPTEDRALAGHPEATFRIDVLGPLDASRDGVQVALGSLRQRAVLGMLAIHHGSSLHRNVIIDVLWGSRPPASAVTEVQGYVSRLRKLLRSAAGGEARQIFVAVGASYRMQANGDRLDVAEFRELTRQAQQATETGDAAQALELFDSALALWRGDVLADIDLLSNYPAAVELAHRRADTVICYAEVAERRGAYTRVLPHLRDLCAREPFNEQAHAHLMAAFAATGQQATALRLFAELRHRLDDELGLPPGALLEAAHARVLRQSRSAAQTAVSRTGTGKSRHVVPAVRGPASGNSS